MKTKLIPFIALLVGVVLWGVDMNVEQIVLQTLTPEFLTLSRLSLTCVILFLMSWILKTSLTVDKADWFRMIITGILGWCLNFTFEFAGVQRTSGALASLILSTIPIMGLIADCLFLKNKMTLVKIIGVIVSVAGVYIIITGCNNSNDFSGQLIGYIFMICTAACWTAYLVLSKPLFEKYSLLTVLAYQNLAAAIAIFPIALMNVPKTEAITPTMILYILFMSIFATVLAELFYSYAMARLSVTVMAIFENVLPVVSVVSGYIIFGSTITKQQIIGGVIVLLAAYIVSFADINKRGEEIQPEVNTNIAEF